MKRLRLAIVPLTVFAIAGIFVNADAPQAQTPDPTVCTMSNSSGPYSPGAMIKVAEVRYRCVPVFGDNLKPRGLGWVKVDESGVTIVR